MSDSSLHFSNVSRKSRCEVFSSESLHLVPIVSWWTCCVANTHLSEQRGHLSAVNEHWLALKHLIVSRQNEKGQLGQMLLSRMRLQCVQIFLFVVSFWSNQTFFLTLIVGFFSSFLALCNLHLFIPFTSTSSLLPVIPWQIHQHFIGSRVLNNYKRWQFFFFFSCITLLIS